MNNILITGATAGFGKAIALNLAKHNVNFILNGRSYEKLKPVIKEIKEINNSIEIYPFIADVRDFNICKSEINKIPEKFRPVDVLINNAGLALELNSVNDADIEDWNIMIDTNIKGVLHLTRLISPEMIKFQNGHIVNIGSISSHEIYKGGNVYCATKHAVLAITQGTRSDLLEYGIRVTQISPGAAETNFSITRFHGNKEKADNVYKGFVSLDANDIADAVEFAITRPKHVNIDEILMTATAQFNGTVIRK